MNKTLQIRVVAVLLASLVSCLAQLGGLAAQQRPYPIALAAGPYSPCSLHSDGRVVCWDVALTDGTIGMAAKPIRGIPELKLFDSGERFSCGLSARGEITCWSDVFENHEGGYEPTVVMNPDDFTGLPRLESLSLGFAHACGIDLDGAVWCIGGNGNGERGLAPGEEPEGFTANRVEGLPRASVVSAGINNTCAATAQGELFCWGSDNNQSPGKPFVFESIKPLQIEFAEGVVSVENGRNFVCAVKPPNAVLCFGSNIMGQLAALESQFPAAGAMQRQYTRDILDLSVSYFAACTLPGTGEVWCWGAWGDKEYFEPQPIDGLPPAEAVSVGEDRGCIISTSKEVWCWGNTVRQGSDGQEIGFHMEPFRINVLENIR